MKKALAFLEDKDALEVRLPALSGPAVHRACSPPRFPASCAFR